MVTTAEKMINRISSILGDAKALELLEHTCRGITKDLLTLPGPNYVDCIISQTDRPTRVLSSIQRLFDSGRLAGTGYLSILPVDQDIEHSAGASFAVNPEYFDPENLVRLAVESGCNAFTSTLGTMGMVARKYAHKIPFIVKLNHNELLSYPALHDQTIFASVQQAFDMGATGVGATVYFGSHESRRQITEISEAFAMAHELGMMTVLWCYVRNNAFKKDGTNYETATDLTGQANRLGVSIEADLIKQKQPTTNGGFTAIGFGKTDPLVYSSLTTDHLIDLTRYQVLNCYAGRVGLVNSGGPSGENDLQQVVEAAVINKRAGGMGLITGRKAFMKPMTDGIELLHALQDVYLDKNITIA